MVVLQFALLGLGAGAVYALLAQGIVLIYRGTGVLNFAHGAYAMAGAYLYYELQVKHGWGTASAFVVAVLAIGVLGVLTHALIMRRLRNASNLVKIIATLGLLSLLQGVATQRYGGNLLSVGAVLPSSPVHVLGVTIIEDRLWLLLIAVVVAVALYVFGRYTRLGLATTAATENQRAAATLGWSPDLIAAASWGVGTSLAAAAGILVAPLIGLQGQTLTLLVVVAMAAGLLGGFKSYPLTLFAGLFVGVAQSEMGRWVTFQGATASLPFALIILVLVVRGKGIPGRDQVTERLPGIGSGRLHPVMLVGFVGLGVFGLLTFFSSNLVTSITVFSTAAIILLSVVVLTGYAGQLSLAQFALAGLGAFIAGKAAAEFHWSLVIVLIIGVIGVVPIGLVLALPALRTRGITLGVVTLGLGVAAQNMIFESASLTGGLSGIQVGPASVFGWSVDSFLHPERYAIVSVVCLILAGLVVATVRRNVAGRRMVAIRTNERAASSLGISVIGAKLYAFGLSSALAGMGGILLAFQSENIVLSHGFDPLSSIIGVGNAVIGGLGYATGPLVGGTFVSGSPGTVLLDKIGVDGNWLTVIGGASILITLLLNQEGVVGGLIETGRKLRRRQSTATVAASVVAERPAVRVRPAELEVVGLTVRFGGVIAVKDLSFIARPGEVTGLIGPNGAGKTTVIDAITGYVRPAAGEIILNGNSLNRRAPFARARAGVCRSFQSLELFEDLTLLENLQAASDRRDGRAYFSSLLPNRQRPLTTAAAAAVEEFDLTADLDRHPSELSYGRRRLLGIARSVATSPSVLLLDEPAAGLDESETARLAHLIRRLAEDWGIAVLLVEHDMGLVMGVCDRIVVLEFGEKIADDAPAAVRRNAAVVASYLGVDEDEVPPETLATISATQQPSGH